MDNYKLLTNKLIEYNNGNFVIDLISQPTEEQMKTLREGSGNPDSEMRQVNSSAGLAVNFWRAYELCHPDASVEFEWKEQKPLKRGIPANIDAVLREKNAITFIESKFLEPYYSGNEVPRMSYKEVAKYSKITAPAGPWVDLFSKAEGFKVYNVVQLCRHLLAIYKDMRSKPKEYLNKTVKLYSVTWKMPEDFLNAFPEEVKMEFRNRTEQIYNEATDCESMLNEFIADHPKMDNICFKAIKYNDILGRLDQSANTERIKKQYFL